MKVNYSKCLMSLVSMLIISLTTCTCKGILTTDSTDSSPDLTPLIFDIPEQQVSRSEIMSHITGNTYYLDAAADDDSGDGSFVDPWKTIAKAQSMVTSGDGVILRAGTYDEYEETAPSGRTNYVVYINEVGASVTMKHIYLRYYFDGKTDAYLIFYGINLTPDFLDPTTSGCTTTGCTDPQYVDSTSSTYPKSHDPVYIYRGKHLQIHNCVLEGPNKYLTGAGVLIDSSEDIIIQHNEIYEVGAIVQFQGVSDVKIFYNNGHDHRSSCFREGFPSVGLVHIEGNHCHDSNFDVTADWCAKADTYHGSAIAIRGGLKVIRNNIFHDGWNSSGIMFYTGGTTIYSNILVENNILYDIHNGFVFRVNNAGSNIVFRNNIFAAYRTTSTNPVFRYGTAFVIHSIAEGYSGPGITFYNNIFIGNTIISIDPHKTENNNIFYTLYGDCDPDIGINSKYVTCAYHPDIAYFEDGSFFNGSTGAATMDFTISHGNILDFTLAPGSEGINFGDPENQPSDSLGSLDGNGFIQKDGTPRDATHHSVGAYEN